MCVCSVKLSEFWNPPPLLVFTYVRSQCVLSLNFQVFFFFSSRVSVGCVFVQMFLFLKLSVACVCIWRCEHESFCVDWLCSSDVPVFIHSLRWQFIWPACTLWYPVHLTSLCFMIPVHLTSLYFMIPVHLTSLYFMIPRTTCSNGIRQLYDHLIVTWFHRMWWAVQEKRQMKTAAKMFSTFSASLYHNRVSVAKM